MAFPHKHQHSPAQIRMGKFVVCFLAFLAVSGLSVEALTNGEVYEILRDFSDDADEFVVSENDDVTYGDDDDAIYLHGDENDEVDVASLAEQLGVNNLNTGDLSFDDGQLVGGGCSCSKDTCRCCTSKTFSVRVLFKKFKAKISTCLTVQYLRANMGFKITFEVNGRTLYRREISLKHPPPLCYGVPGLKIASVCLQFYNIDLRERKMCAKIVGVVDFKIKKISYGVPIACFKLPITEDKQVVGSDEETYQMTSHDDQMPNMNIAELFQMLEKGEMNPDDLEFELSE